MGHDPDRRLPGARRRARTHTALVLTAALLTARAAEADTCLAPAGPSGGVSISVLLEAEGGSNAPAADRRAWDGLRDALRATPLPKGVTLEVRGETEAQPPPKGTSTAIVRIRGGVLQVGALRVLALIVAFDTGDDRPDLSVDVQDRVFGGRVSRDWLPLPATALEDDPGHAAGASPSVHFLRGLIAYLAHRTLPASCVAEAQELKAAAITSLRRWDGPRQEEIAAEASAVAKQLRAFLQFDDDGCKTFDGGEDPVRLLVAAARLAPHRPENRRLAVMAQLHRAAAPAPLCGAAVERDLLASVALAPEDQGTLAEAGMAYDVLAQGAPPPFAAGEEIDRVEAFRQMRRVPPAHRPKVRGVLEVGLGGIESLKSSGDVAPGARLEVWVGPRVVPLALRLAAELTAVRDIPFAPRGTGSWRRDVASLGLGYRLGRQNLFVDLFADGAVAAAHVEGSGFFENRSTVNLDAGFGGGVRAGWAWRHLALSAELAGQAWAIPQWAEVDGLADRHRLPQGDLSVGVLVSFVSGIGVQ